MNKSYALCFLFLIGICGAQVNKAKVTLKVIGAESVIPIQDFKDKQYLSDDVYSILAGGFTSTIKDNISYNGFVAGYATLDNVFPAIVNYNITGDVVDEISRVHMRKDVGIANIGFSVERGFAVVSTYMSFMNRSFTAPNLFTLEFHRMNNGILNQVPIVTDMRTLDPEIWWYTVAYNFMAGVSEDGRIEAD